MVVDDQPNEYDLGEKTFTLLELYKGMFWEMAFMGTPERRDQQLEELKKTIEGIESGEVETIPWEEVKAKFKKKKDSLNLLGGEEEKPEE